MRTPPRRDESHGEGAVHSPPAEIGDPHAPANATGLRHVAFAVDDIDALADRSAPGHDVWLALHVPFPPGVL
jgi:hypothetical protein